MHPERRSVLAITERHGEFLIGSRLRRSSSERSASLTKLLISSAEDALKRRNGPWTIPVISLFLFISLSEYVK